MEGPEFVKGESWRYGTSKNEEGPMAFYGYRKWKELTYLFLELQKYPNFQLARYEDLIRDYTAELIKDLFWWVGLSIDSQTTEFLFDCHAVHHSDYYSVYKDPSKYARWKELMPLAVISEIMDDLRGSALERFLFDVSHTRLAMAVR